MHGRFEEARRSTTTSEATPGVVPARMPDISLGEHPIYPAHRGGVRLTQRLLALARVIQMSIYVLIVLARQLLRRTGWSRTDGGPCLEHLNCDGMFPHRLSSAGKREIVDAAQPYFSRLDASRNNVRQGRRSYCDNQLDTTRNGAPELFDAIGRILAETGIMSSVRSYLACRAEIRRVTVQINDEWDTFWRAPFEDRNIPIPPTAFFHIDNTYGVVKIIFYVSKVDENNGPFSYVPGPHRIKVPFFDSLVLRATDIWLDVHPDERHLFPALPRFLRKKAKFGDDIRPGSDWGRWLVNHERVMTSEDGDTFVFDVKGIHRGGMVQRGERRIIQVMVS